MPIFDFLLGFVIGGGLAILAVVIVAFIAAAGWMNSGSH